MNPASNISTQVPQPSQIPAELLALRARIRAMPAEVRAELEPLAEDACEQAKFRGRALSLAREALEQFRLELSAAKFDLDMTRREREGLRHLMEREF
ncbi:hypothetical protein P12x_000411 [Tundrisphaera lichenicola]|uniref:hypothetical protein n=1 Tax=Tundrisphaera lichenicola TaxID=2029860 RepID=UPI003EC07CC2